MPNDKRPAPQTKSPAPKTTGTQRVTDVQKSASPPSFKPSKPANPNK